MRFNTRTVAVRLRHPAPPHPHAQEPIGDVQSIYDGKLSPELAVTTFRNNDRLYIHPTKNVVIVVWQAQTQPTGGEVIDDMVAFDAIAKVLP